MDPEDIADAVLGRTRSPSLTAYQSKYDQLWGENIYQTKERQGAAASTGPIHWGIQTNGKGGIYIQLRAHPAQRGTAAALWAELSD